ncbi:unnamed protein product [Sphagnum troendelagicum]
MAMFIQKLFGAAEPTWMDHGYREEEQEEPYYAETMSYRIYPEPPSSFTRYPEHPLQPLTFAHLFEPPPLPMFNNYPAALLPYGGHLFFEPPTKLVRFSDPGLEQQPARRPQVIRRSSQPKKVHPEIELRVPMCCRKCEDKVEIELKKMEGVTKVMCDRVNQKVTVTGKVDPELLLKRAKNAKKKAEFWSGTIYSQNFIDFIQSKTAPKQPEVDVFSSFRHQSSAEMESDTYDLHHETESSVPFTHPSPSDSKWDDDVATPYDSEQSSSSYNQLPSSYSERDTYDCNGERERGIPYSQHLPAYGVMDSLPSSMFPSSLSYRHHSYEERDYSPEYESCSTSFHQYEPACERYDSDPHQGSVRSVYGHYTPSSYGELEDYPHNVYSSRQPLGAAGITNPNYMKRIIDY